MNATKGPIKWFGVLKLALWTIVPLLTVSLPACNPDSEYTRINFSKKTDTGQTLAAANDPGALRVAVAAMVSPAEALNYYQQLMEYLGEAVDSPIRIIQRKTYAEINALFPKGQIDLAFVCSGPYATERLRFGFEAVATPVVFGQPMYQSYLIVRENSPFQHLDDLKGRSFAFTDPDSNTGALVPKYWLQQKGQLPSSFFGSTTYTYSHDNSIMAVARGLVDAASVDGLKWEFYNRKAASFARKTRVIKKSKPFGSPPLVASVKLDLVRRDKIRKAILTMHQTQRGQQILSRLMIDRFVPPQDDWYRPIQAMSAAVNQTKGTFQ
jgi:phosphonate transport system substrate-binding protein